jgi:hypothetical protein
VFRRTLVMQSPGPENEGSTFFRNLAIYQSTRCIILFYFLCFRSPHVRYLCIQCESLNCFSAQTSPIIRVIKNMAYFCVLKTTPYSCLYHHFKTDERNRLSVCGETINSKSPWGGVSVVRWSTIWDRTQRWACLQHRGS